MSKITVNQHYIWQHYLRAWSVRKKIWCKRLDQSEAFLTLPRNVGSERYFYEAHELSGDDLHYLEQVILQSKDEKLQELNRGWIRSFQASFVIRRQLNIQSLDPSLRKRLDIELQDIEKSIGEKFHTGMEERAVPILNALRQGNAEFYINTEDCSTFIQFISFQYFRTAKLRNAMFAIEHPLSHHMKRTWPIESFIYATNLGASIFRQRHQYKIVFIYNNSDIAFIAGDQPVINLSGIDTNDLDLFYPLTPSIALIYTANQSRYASLSKGINRIGVEAYNYKIYSSADSQIFGTDPVYLKSMTKIPKDL